MPTFVLRWLSCNGRTRSAQGASKQTPNLCLTPSKETIYASRSLSIVCNVTHLVHCSELLTPDPLNYPLLLEFSERLNFQVVRNDGFIQIIHTKGKPKSSKIDSYVGVTHRSFEADSFAWTSEERLTRSFMSSCCFWN